MNTGITSENPVQAMLAGAQDNAQTIQ